MDTGRSKFWIAVIVIFSYFACYEIGYYYGECSVEPIVITKDSIEIRDSIRIDSIFIENKEIEKQIIYIEKTFDEKFLLSLIILIVPIWLYSQTTSTVTITSDQLKTVNIIFAEHEMLKKKVPLLEHEIANYQAIDSIRQKVDSIQTIKITNLNTQVATLNNKVAKQKKGIKVRNWSIAGLSLCLLVLLL